MNPASLSMELGVHSFSCHKNQDNIKIIKSNFTKISRLLFCVKNPFFPAHRSDETHIYLLLRGGKEGGGHFEGKEGDHNAPF